MAKIRHVASVEIRAPVEAVWKEITRRDAPQRALFDTVLVTDLRPGSPYRYSTPDRKRTFIVGRILEIDPPRRLVTTFGFARDRTDYGRATWTLEATPAGTRVTLVHEDLDTGTSAGRRIASTWDGILRDLRSLLETGRLPFGSRFKLGLMKVALPLFPKDRPGEYA